MSSASSCIVFVLRSCHQSRQCLRGEIHHGDDARIVQPCGADHADHADHLAIAPAIGRGDHRRAGQREQLVLRSDEDPASPSPSRALSSRRAISCLSSSSSSSWRTRSRSAAAVSSMQIGLAAHDQHRAAARRPRSRPRGPRATSVAAALVERCAPVAISRASRACASASVRPDETRGDDNCRPRPARRRWSPGASSTTRFSTLPSAPTSTASAAVGDSGTKPSCAQPQLALRHQDQPGAGRQARQQRAASPPAPPRSARRAISAPRSRALLARSARRPASCRRRTGAGPLSVGIRPAEVCGAASRPSSSRSCITLRIEAGDRLSARHRRASASRPACRARDRTRPPAGRCRARGRSVRSMGVGHASHVGLAAPAKRSTAAER